MNKISEIDVQRFMGVKDVSCYFRLGSKIKFQNVLFIVPRFGTRSFDVFKAEKDPSVCLKRFTFRDGVDCSLPWQYLVEKLRKMSKNLAISLTRAVYCLRSTSSQSISEKKTDSRGVKSTTLFYCVLRIYEFKMPTSFFTNPKYQLILVQLPTKWLLLLCQIPRLSEFTNTWNLSHVPLVVILHYFHVFVCFLFDCLPIISCPGRTFGRGIRGI